MRYFLIHIHLVVWCSLFFSQLHAQTYPFSNITVDNGLPQGQVLSAFQNDDGLMWFGTNGGGISKYDGKTFEYITDKEGLADNLVFCMAKYKDGQILIGTNNGLSVYNNNAPLNTPKFKNYTIKNGLSDNRIFRIFFDNQGNVLLGTGKGISTFKDGVCQRYKINPTVDSASVFYLYSDSKDELWMATLGSGIFSFDGKTLKDYKFKPDVGSSMVFSVIEKSKNVYWFLTGEGLLEYANNEIYPINPGKINASATYYYSFKDRSNAIWIGSSEGLIKQTKDDKVVVFKKQNGLVDNSIWSIFQDREDNLWFTSDQNGVSKISSERFYMYTSKDGLLKDEVKHIYQSKTGEYWVGTVNGVSVLKNGKYTNYAYKELIGNPDVWCVTQDRNGNYLVGTSNGLVIFNGSTFQRILCKDKESLYNAIFDIYVDRDGVIWLGTQVGLAKIVDGHIEPFNDYFVTKSYLIKIYQDANKNFWYATDEGLFKYDGKVMKHFSEKDGFTSKRVRNIINDKSGNLWFATSGGVYMYDGKKFNNIAAKVDYLSNEVYSIVIDKKENVWAGLSNGVVKISNKNNNYKIRFYGIEDGFLGQVCNQNAMIIDTAGRLNVGTYNGMMVYQEEFDRDNVLEPITKLKRVDLFFQETKWSEYTDSVNIHNIPHNLQLPYDKNYLTFQFIGVSLTAPDKVSYKYMLKGLDKDWRLTSKNEATYSNIPPGHYEFLVMASNGEGVWNKEPVSLKFVILPPFWRTWWFYSIIALIILSGIYSYIKIRNANSKILKQNEIIEEKNNALQDANDEIAEKNRNITDSINYAKRIQQSFLTSQKILDQLLKDYFILFKPRDIVSGDFYLAFDLPDRTVIICSDCTGHGIPGAFMSLIGISLLNEMSRSKQIVDTAQILEELRSIIISSLNPERLETGGKDGMDISAIAIFKEAKNNQVRIQFSGANSGIYIVSSNKMDEHKGDKQPVGYYSNMKPFTQHEILANKGDIIYLHTDGYADQFGGERGKKLMKSELKKQILAIHHLPLQQQKHHLDDTLVKWQGDLEQVDDVTVVGIKL